MMVCLVAASSRGRGATCAFRMIPACTWRSMPESGNIDTMRAKTANPGSVAIVVYDGVSLFELGAACDVFGDHSGGAALHGGAVSAAPPSGPPGPGRSVQGPAPPETAPRT